MSVAETAFQDVHKRAQLTIALVASDGRYAESVLDKLDSFVERNGGAVIVSVQKRVH